MLDTVVLTTESLTTAQYQHIQMQLQARSGVEPSTGEVKYLRYVASPAIPSTGAIVRMTVDTAKWVKMPGEKAPYRVACKSLRVEGSVHKAMHGHNVYGGEPDPQAAMAWLIKAVAALLSCDLPPLERWQCARVDFAASFDLGTLANVRGWIRAKSLVVYPRREMEFYSDLGFIARGTTTTVRAYAKGPQFHKEGGYKQLLMCSSPDHAFEVSRIADRTLRCEIECKPPKLAQFSSAADITEGWLRSVYEEEWRKLLRPIDSDTRLVHTAVEVANRLASCYPDHWLSLYLVWCGLAIRGEQYYRQNVPSSTWREQRRKLETASVSWTETDVLTLNSPANVASFYPALDEPRHLDEVLPYERVA